MSEKFGVTETEKSVEKILTCRKIVKEIINFGLSQNQILMIIQFLGQELENHEQMVEVVTMTKEFLSQNTETLLEVK